MNPEEKELLEGLRALAEDGPHDVPAGIEQRLLSEFRRRSQRRRLRTWISAASTGAIAALIAVAIWVGPTRSRPVVPQPEVAVSDETADFYPLPDAESLPPVENGLVVRVQLPVESLAMIGFPIDQMSATDQVEAEVLLGQDGLARGVRLIE